LKKLIIYENPILNISTSFDDQTRAVEHLVIENQFKQNIYQNVYLGKIVNIVDHLEGAFVDIGEKENAFILKKDLLRILGIFDASEKIKPLSQLTHKNQLILCQVSREPFQNKGAQLSSEISIGGRYFVLLPFSRGIKFSKQILDKSKFNTFTETIKNKLGNCGLIIRFESVSQLENEDVLIYELELLLNIWSKINTESKMSSKIKCLHRPNEFNNRLFKEFDLSLIGEFIVQSPELIDMLTSKGVDGKKIKLDTSKQAIFNQFGLNMLDIISDNVFTMENGISYVLNELEAFTIIDINSGQYQSRNDRNQTIYEINMEAAMDLKQKIELRNISGNILIDFIGMVSLDQEKFLSSLKAEVFKYSDGYYVIGFTRLGILELTKKRILPSIKDVLSHDYRLEDLRYWHLSELYESLKKISYHTNTKKLTVYVSDHLFVFLSQNQIFKDLNLQISIKRNHIQNHMYQITSNPELQSK